MANQLEAKQILGRIGRQEVGERIRPVPAVSDLRRIETAREIAEQPHERQQNMQSQARAPRATTEIEEPRTQRVLPRRLQATPGH